MGCRTRVIGNVCGDEIVSGRGNLSFTTINLPRLGIKYGSIKNIELNINGFFKELDEKIDLVIEQLLKAYGVQGNKKVKELPILNGTRRMEGL